jgi:uncharacterized protein (TIRG00374 family)
MDLDLDLRGVVLGFAGAVLVLSVLLWSVGVEELAAALRRIERSALAAIAAAALCWLAAWGQSLRTVLGALDVRVRPGRAVLLYAAAVFANNVTPFGQAGGEPVSAYLISRATHTSYERSLAAIASVDALNFVPSILFALVGLVYYGAAFTFGEHLYTVVAIVVGLAVAVPTTAYAVWRTRERLARRLAGTSARVLAALTRFVPRIQAPSKESILARFETFTADIERVATDRRTLIRALGFSALGWLSLMTALWLSLAALGHPVAPWVVFVVIPVGAVAGIAPLPGGLGGIELALVLLLVPITALPVAVATSAALVYRGGTYWFPTLLGGAAVAWLQGQH